MPKFAQPASAAFCHMFVVRLMLAQDWQFRHVRKRKHCSKMFAHKLPLRKGRNLVLVLTRIILVFFLGERDGSGLFRCSLFLAIASFPFGNVPCKTITLVALKWVQCTNDYFLWFAAIANFDWKDELVAVIFSTFWVLGRKNTTLRVVQEIQIETTWNSGIIATR